MGRTFEITEDGITFELEEAEEGGYTITVPELPGCVSEGDTEEEALSMIKDAMRGWVTVVKMQGTPLPERYLPYFTVRGPRPD